MKRRVVLGCVAVLLASCAQAVEEGEPTLEGGSLMLALTANDSAGVGYRLRNAQLEISGYPEGYYGGGGWMGSYGGSYGGGYYNEQFSSDDYLDQSTINLRLVPGYYNVGLLNSDYYLERQSGGGDWERVEQVVLLSSSYQSAYVWDGGTAYVNFRFGVDGQLIDFRSGELQVGIEIERPGERCVPGYGGYGGYWGGYGGYGGYYGGYPGPCGAAGGGAVGAAGVGGGAGVGGSAGAPLD